MEQCPGFHRNAVHYTLAAVGLTGVAAMAFWALHTAASQAGPTEVDFSRLFSLLVIFFLVGSTLANARNYHALARAATQIIERASRLRRQAAVEAVELYKVLSAYDSALAKAPPIPTYAYKILQKRLTTAWDEVRAFEKPRVQAAVAAEEPTRANT